MSPTMRGREGGAPQARRLCVVLAAAALSAFLSSSGSEFRRARFSILSSSTSSLSSVSSEKSIAEVATKTGSTNGTRDGGGSGGGGGGGGVGGAETARKARNGTGSSPPSPTSALRRRRPATIPIAVAMPPPEATVAAFSGAATTGGGVAHRDGRLVPLASIMIVRSSSSSISTPPDMSPSNSSSLPPPPPPVIAGGCDVSSSSPSSSFRTYRPNCNVAHELDLGGQVMERTANKVGKGGSKVVWGVEEPRSFFHVDDVFGGGGGGGGGGGSMGDGPKGNYASSCAVKTLRWTRDFLPLSYSRTQSEVSALDLLGTSPGVADAYGHCGTTSWGTYAAGGDLSGWVKRMVRRRGQQRMNSGNVTEKSLREADGGGEPSLSPESILYVSMKLARAVADLYGGPSPSSPSTALQVVHRDIDAANVLISDDGPRPGRVFLGDLDQAYVLRKWVARDAAKGREGGGEDDEEEGAAAAACSYRESFLCGEDNRRTDTRSPEECRSDSDFQKRQRQNRHRSASVTPSLSPRSVDAYGLGTVLFYLLTSGRYRPYNLNDGADAHQPPRSYPDFYRKLVLSEEVEPALPREVERSSDPAIVAVREATRDAMRYDPERRATAEEVAERLEGAWRRIYEEKKQPK